MKLIKIITSLLLVSFFSLLFFYGYYKKRSGQSILEEINKITGNPWSLTIDEKRNYLHYYSPIIFKASNETADTPGFDWITSFNFDKDMIYKNNKNNWGKLPDYIYGGQYQNWQIRPTLYTFIIEFMTDKTKSIILVYHIYHAKQLGSIHDWERIEMRFDNVGFTPDNGEELAYIVITEHGKHSVPTTYTSKDLNFYKTGYGNHPIIYQAGYSITSDTLTKGELHYVEQSIETVLNQTQARVNINGYSRVKKFHYIFVDETDQEAVENLNALSINHVTAADLSVKTSSTIDLISVPRITYELQDVADIIPSQLMDGDWNEASTRTIALVSEIIRYDNNNVKAKLQIQKDNGKVSGYSYVDYSMEDYSNDNLYYNSRTYKFYSRALDVDTSGGRNIDARSGYINKSWFLGTYTLDGRTGYQPDGWDSSYQHIYFAHDGVRNNGMLLKSGNWYDEKNGGFDGRWIQLFDDN